MTAIVIVPGFRPSPSGGPTKDSQTHFLPSPHLRNMDASSRIGISKPKADQAAINFTPSQAKTTTYAGSIADNKAYADDGRTNVSTYSYRSGLDANKYLKEVHGRVAYNRQHQTRH